MLMCAWSRLLQQPTNRRNILVGLRGRHFFSGTAKNRSGLGIPGTSSVRGRAIIGSRLVSLQRLAEKADNSDGGNANFSLSKRSINAAAASPKDPHGKFVEEFQKEAIKKQGAGGGMGYFSTGLGLAVLCLGTTLMIPVGRTEEISVGSVENAALQVGRRIFGSLETLAGKVGTFTVEVLDAFSTAVVLLKCLKSVLESYGEGVTKGWWRARVAAFLADVSAAGGDRRRAMLSAGHGVVVDWLLETAAKSQGPGSIVIQGEAARALSFLVEDEATCESVLARPHSIPNLLRFSASLPANLRPRTYQHRKKLTDVGSSRGKSQLVAAIMEIVTASCDTSDDVFRPKLPGTADPTDIAAALAVVEEGCSQLVDDSKDGDDDSRGRGQGIGMKLVGGTGLIGMQMFQQGLILRWFLNLRENLQHYSMTKSLKLGLVDTHPDKDLVGYGLWDDLQGRFVAVPLAAWAIATWADSSIANRNHIAKLDSDGLALMAAVQAPERTVKWHGARTIRLLLDNTKNLPRDDVILLWSSALLDLAVQSCGHGDSALVQEALSAFTSCLKNGRVAHLPALEKAFPVMRGLAHETVENVKIQKSIARAIDVLTASTQLPFEECKGWSGILLRWVSSRQSDKGTQSSASAVLSKVVNTLGEASIPVSQTLLALLLVDLVKYAKPEAKSAATVSKEAKAKGLLQSQALQSATQAASSLGKVVSLEAKVQAAISGTAADLPLMELLGPDFVPVATTKNGTKEQLPKVTVAEAASAVAKAVKALTDLSAEDQVFQKRIIDSGGLCILRRLMLADDYEKWFALDASAENDPRTQAVKDKEAAEVAEIASHSRKHAARLLTVLTKHPQVSQVVANDKEWCSWLEDCAAGRISGCNDLKSLSYAQMALDNVAQSQRRSVKGFGRDITGDGVWPRYEDNIFLLSKGQHKQEPEVETDSSTVQGSDVDNTTTEDKVASEETVHRAGNSSEATSPVMDVVFIHGLAGGPIKTWRVADNKTSTTGKSGLIEKVDEQAGREGTCWPYEWLSDDLPQSRLISVKYKTNFSEWSGATLPLEEISSMILDKLLAAGVGERPVVFISHSMGGLVVKQMLLQAIKDKSRSHLADRASGVVFYSCPHFGSRLADMPWRMGYVLRPAPSVAELRSGSPRLEELNRCVRNLHNRGSLQVLSFSETKVTPLVEGYGGWALRMEVVPIESAYPGYGELVVLDGTDHVNSCKPLSPSDPAYTRTLEFLRKIESKFKSK